MSFNKVNPDGSLRRVAGNASGTGGGNIEGYYNSADGKFYEDSAYTTEIVGAADIVYIDRPNNVTYWHNGTNFVRLDSDGQGGQVTTLPAAIAANEGKVLQYIGVTTETLTRGFFYICEDDGEGGYKWNVLDVEPDSAEPTQYETMPTAEADREGEIVQYIGETDADYTNGYFYKCVYKNGVWTWVNVEVQTGSSGVTSAGKYNWTSVASNFTGYVLFEAEHGRFLPAAQYVISAGGSQYLLSISKHQLSDTVLYHLSGDANAITNFKVTWSDNPYGIVLSFDHTVSVSFEQIAGENITSFSKITSITQRQIDDLFNVPVKDLTISDGQTIQYDIMPTASVDLVGRIVQYVGTTDASYTNGYFYKCVPDTSTTPTTYKWEQTDVQPTDDTPIWTGTQTEHDAEVLADTLPYNALIGITDNDGENITWYSRDDEGTETLFGGGSGGGAQIDDNHSTATTTYSSNKINQIAGTVMEGASQYADGEKGLAPKPVAGDNQKALFGDGRYHTIYAANTGSTIVVVTDEPTLYGRPVTLTAGSTTLSGTFDSTGECTFNNLAVYGAVQIASSDSEGNPSRGSTNITYFGTYVVGIGFNFATIKFTSSDVTLAGTPVAIYKGDVLVAETSLSIVGSGQLEAVAYVEELGVYKALAETTEGKARASVKVTALRQEYTAELIVAQIYGFEINHLDSNPATCVQPYSLGDYEVINADFTPAHMDYANDVFNYGSWGGLATCDRNEIFFAPKPCMLRYDGTVDYYLNPNDYAKKLDGSASDVADLTYEGNCMVEFPTIYFKRWMVGDMEYVLIADKQVDMDFHAYTHHDVNGNVLPYIYLSAYDGCYDGTRIRSISGCGYTASLSPGNVICYTTWQQKINFAQANNLTGYTGEGWYIKHKADWDMVNDLLILIGMTTDTQATYGRGNDSRGGNGCIGTGTMDNKGLFWGSNDGTSGVKVFGIENWWANNWKLIAGWINANGTQKVKMTYGQEDGSTTDGFNLDGTGYVTISNSTPTGTSSGYISTYYTTEYGLIPKNAGGSASTYLCDCMWYDNGQLCFAAVSCDANGGARCGAFATHLGFSATVTTWSFSAALSYKGIAT